MTLLTESISIPVSETLCTICKRKSRWKEHLNGKHNFTRPEADDDPRMIKLVRDRINFKKKNITDQEIRTQIIESIVSISGKCDIPTKKTASKVFREFIFKLITIGITISQKYNGNLPDINNYLYSTNYININNAMNSLASKEKQIRLKPFLRMKIINVLADAGTVLGFKYVHAMLSHPGIDDSLPFDVYENHNFTQNDYYQFFTNIFGEIFKLNLQIASFINDQVPSQMKGAI